MLNATLGAQGDIKKFVETCLSNVKTNSSTHLKKVIATINGRDDKRTRIQGLRGKQFQHIINE